MKTKIIIRIFSLIIAIICFGLGCNLAKRTGTLKINLTDQPGDYEEVYITFSEVSVHRGEGQDNESDAGWIIISDEEKGYDLLTLQDGNFDLLAEADLAAGTYTQIRLKIDDGEDQNGDFKTYVKIGGEKFPLIVPSGTKSGLKLIHPFRIEADNETVLYIDFDADKSVKQTGNGKYKLRPTISVLSDLSPGQCDQGISGTVQDNSTMEPIEDAAVSAFVDTDNALEPKASSLTDEEGDFKLCLPPETYILKVEAEGYATFTSDPIEVESEFIELDPIKLQ